MSMFFGRPCGIYHGFLIIPGRLRLAIVPTDRGFCSITEGCRNDKFVFQ